MLNIEKLTGTQINSLMSLPPIKLKREFFQVPERQARKKDNSERMGRWVDAYSRKFYSRKAKSKRYEKNLGKYISFDVEEAEAIVCMSALHMYLYTSFLLTLHLANGKGSSD